ncbi:NAD-dependent epimerase/dehydratase family protein [Mucilaginibacter myungsuensis]|uniref:NAD(P)-dependent oxidoreductase n=1 Tax=Mucilaginibacter myungsuensis TaxID=649104 RepID=A0A929KZT6_9SPHI|nr:NAD(P)-dependent oxidoreductase [Mucilaginibacter myungsuensis]MBE9661889.1 NAD(P)-dependent oxidoreductase [Mucilaginibacter myungsuensis]MDN3599677.1 NAD(P)-dependent oxidoreductase [Mucilaginibacter myungsuensis]
MKEKVLITGASGFVGFHLIEEALKNDLEVYAAIRKSSSIDHLKGLDVNFVYPSFSNADALTKEFAENGYQYVIHAAGLTRALTEERYNEVNVGYTVNLAKAAAATPGFKKFVLISSLAAVGPLPTLTGMLTEKSIPRPVTAYGQSKLNAEHAIKTISGLNCIILRPTAVYGPRDKDIFIALKQFSKGFEPYIGRTEQKMSFIYVTDLAKAAVRALYNGKNQAYNLSDGNFYDRYQLANITTGILRVKTYKVHLPVKFIKIVAGLADIFGSLRKQAPVLSREKLHELTAVNWYCAIDEAKHDLGFYPQHDLNSGLNETISWYKANGWL